MNTATSVLTTYLIWGGRYHGQWIIGSNGRWIRYEEYQRDPRKCAGWIYAHLE